MTTPVGVYGEVGVVAVPVPIALIALTRKRYAIPLVNPVTVREVVSNGVVSTLLQVVPPSLDISKR